MGIARDFKFGVRIDRQPTNQRIAKVGEKGRGLRHVTYFYNFGIPFISLEQTKLETSNLVCGLTSTPSNQKNAKVGEKGRGLRHVTYFYNFGTPFISLEWTKLETSNLACGLISRPTIQKTQK